MRFVVYERIWHGFNVLHCHLLLMINFGIPSQKGGVHIESTLHFVFVFRGRVVFCWLELVELFRFYLGVLLCTFNFLALATFALLGRDIHDKGSIFVFYVSCFKLLIDLCL